MIAVVWPRRHENVRSCSVSSSASGKRNERWLKQATFGFGLLAARMRAISSRVISAPVLASGCGTICRPSSVWPIQACVASRVEASVGWPSRMLGVFSTTSRTRPMQMIARGTISAPNWAIMM